MKSSILFLLLLIGGFDLCLSEPLTYVLLGYKDNVPVFRTLENNELYRYKDSLESIGDFRPDLKPVFVNDSIHVFVNKIQKNKLLVYKNSRHFEVELREKPYSLCATNSGDSIFYIKNLDAGAQIMLLHNGTISVFSKVKAAWLESVKGNYLYYLQYTKEGYPWVDVCRLKIEGDGESEIILRNLRLEETDILPNGYITTSVFFDGKYTSVVYEILKKKFYRLSFNGYKNHFYAFENIDGKLCFYDPNGFNVYRTCMEEELSVDERYLPEKGKVVTP